MSKTPKTQKGKTEKIFSILKTYGFHAQDIQYGNGYFVFEHGKDMVVNFHIEECKGWLFGIWWNLEDKNKFDFFAQFEKTIDKFKPNASTYVAEEVEYCENCEQEIKFDVKPMLEFIKKHPYVAWEYDNGFTYKIWDYKTPFESWKEYIKFNFQTRKRERIAKRINKKYLKLLKSICDEVFPNYKIIDENKDGIKCYPRYDVICENYGEKGRYSVDLEEELNETLYKKTVKFDKWQRKLEKKGLGYNLDTAPFDGKLYYWVKN